MAEIDYSIASKIAPPVFDPLATVGKIQGVQQGMLQNRLLGQEVAGKIARGKAAQGAINPDGTFDPNRFMLNLQADPAGAQLAPEAATLAATQRQAGLTADTAQVGLDKAKLDLSAQRWTKVGDTAGGLLAGREPLTRESVIKSLTDNLVGSGMFNDEDSVGMLTKFVQELPTDDAGLRNKLKQVYAMSGMSLERINTLLGAPSSVDTGAEIIQKQVSPLTGDAVINAVVPKERSPSEKAALVQRYNPTTKTMELVPSGVVIGDAAPGMATGPVGMAGPALGVAEAETGAAAESVKQAQALRAVAERVPETNAALLNIRDLVPGFNPGAKTNWMFAAKALATQMGVASAEVRTEVAAQEEFNKLATQFINAQVGQLGGSGTDAKLESAAKGTPNEFMSKEGILGVTALMMGLNDAVAQKDIAWQKWLDAGNSPGSYGKFTTEFNKLYNPRVFQSVYMSPAQRGVMLNNMTPAERTRFEEDTKRALRAGWITPNGR